MDFSLFGPYGERAAKLRKYEALVWVDGKWVTRQLKGPSTFEAWEECWKVFAAAMVSLGAASPNSLDKYLRPFAS